MPLTIAMGFVVFTGIANLLTFLKQFHSLQKNIPADIIVMRLIEIFNSIPLVLMYHCCNHR